MPSREQRLSGIAMSLPAIEIGHTATAGESEISRQGDDFLTSDGLRIMYERNVMGSEKRRPFPLSVVRGLCLDNG